MNDQISHKPEDIVEDYEKRHQMQQIKTEKFREMEEELHEDIYREIEKINKRLFWIDKDRERAWTTLLDLAIATINLTEKVINMVEVVEK